MAGSSLQSGANQEKLTYRSSRLKIRRGPSFSALASYSSSFHGRSCRQMMTKKGCTTVSRTDQPLIFHTFEPEVIITEPAEFMPLVQRLTGSPATRKLLRKWKSMKLQSVHSLQGVADRESTVQQDPLKEGQTIILAPSTAVLSCCANYADHASTNRSPAAISTCSNHSGLRESLSHDPQLTSAINQASDGDHPLAAPSASPFTKQLNLGANHPANHPQLASISANSATNEEHYSNYTSSSSPFSPNCSLTTSSEGCFSMEEGGASSSSREALCCLEEGSTLSTEEEEEGGFFVFSIDSYYGNHDYTTAQDELDQFLSFSNAVDPF